MRTSYKPGQSGNLSGRPDVKWIRDRLHAVQRDKTSTAREQILEHLIEMATAWEVRVIGRDSDGELLKVASGRDAVEAAKLLLAYYLGKPPAMPDVLAIAEHMRHVERDRIDIMLRVLGDRTNTMTLEELKSWLKECSGSTDGFLNAAMASMGDGATAKAAALPESETATTAGTETATDEGEKP